MSRVALIDLVHVYDGQQEKMLTMAPKRALHLVTSYSNRFRYATAAEQATINPQSINSTSTEQENFEMGHKLPEPFTAFKDGTHRITIVSSQVTAGKFGEQEEMTAVDTEGNTGRIWVSLNSRKQIDNAAAAGIVTIDPNTEDWTVNVGASCTLVVAGGKNVALLPLPKDGQGK